MPMPMINAPTMSSVRYFASPVCGGLAGVARLDRRAADRLVGVDELGRPGLDPNGGEPVEPAPDDFGPDEPDGGWLPPWKPRDFLLTHLLRVMVSRGWSSR